MEYHIVKAEVILEMPFYPEDGETLEQDEIIAERRLDSVLDCSWVKLIESYIKKREDS